MLYLFPYRCALLASFVLVACSASVERSLDDSAPKANEPDASSERSSKTAAKKIVIPAACKAGTLPQRGLTHGTVRIETPTGEVEFDVELALTSKQRQVGLMCREHLGDGTGMLFVFNRDRVNSFWMRNTLIPLDMLFIDSTGAIVGQVLNATPLTTTGRSVSLKSRLVLELPAGTVKAKGIAPGQRITFVNVPGAPKP